MNRRLLIAGGGGGVTHGVSEMPLAVMAYGTNPLTTYSATIADPPVQAIDGTNLKITFTAPSSGKVLVVLKAWQDISSGSMLWGLLESGSVVAGSCGVVDRSNTIGAMTVFTVYLSGVSAGSHTYVWGWSNGDTMRLFAGDGATQDVGEHIWAPAIMEIWSVA